MCFPDCEIQAPPTLITPGAIIPGLNMACRSLQLWMAKGERSAPQASFLLALLLLTSCVIPIPIPISIKEDPAHYAARIEPPARYNHPYNGRVVERILPKAEVHTVCMSVGTDFFNAAFAAACSWQSNGTCYIVLPNDERVPVANFSRHEIAHCNGWRANHPRDG